MDARAAWRAAELRRAQRARGPAGEPRTRRSLRRTVRAVGCGNVRGGHAGLSSGGVCEAVRGQRRAKREKKRVSRSVSVSDRLREPARASRNLARRAIRSGRVRRVRREGRAAESGAARVRSAPYAERATRWDATYPLRAERAERELRRLVVSTAVRLVRRRDPRRGHAAVGVHGRASVCFCHEQGRRKRGERCQSLRFVSRVGRASPQGRLDEGVRAPQASPRAWVLAPGESGQSTHLLRARRLVRGRRRSGRVHRVFECVNREGGKRQNARRGCGADMRGAVRLSGHLEAQAIGKWRQRAARRRCSSADSASRNRRSCDSFRTYPLPAIDSPLSPRPKPRPTSLGAGAPLPPLSVVDVCATGGGT